MEKHFLKEHWRKNLVYTYSTRDQTAEVKQQRFDKMYKEVQGHHNENILQ
jgi:hypothetical protein